MAGARRSVPTPLQRGAAVAAVTGGALSLVGVAVPLEAPTAGAAFALGASRTVVLPAGQSVPSVQVQPSTEPVAPDPQVADATELVKAVQMAEQEVARLTADRGAAAERASQERAADERSAEEEDDDEDEDEPPSGSPDCGPDTSDLGAVKSHVRAAAGFLGCLHGEPTMHGVAGRGGSSDHPSGRAVDFMVNRSTGDALAECAIRNQSELGITYVIWRQRINHGSGWKPMSDRGSATANHFDHVHVSFGSSGGGGEPRC